MEKITLISACLGLGLLFTVLTIREVRSILNQNRFEG
jgi:hypothetical protein